MQLRSQAHDDKMDSFADSRAAGLQIAAARRLQRKIEKTRKFGGNECRRGASVDEKSWKFGPNVDAGLPRLHSRHSPLFLNNLYGKRV